MKMIENQSYWFQNANIITMEKDEVLSNMDIEVVNGKIAQILHHDVSKIEGNIIDATGKYIIPGLMDSHVHIQCKNDLDWFLRYGILSVANMQGRAKHLKWQKKIREGNLRGPDIVTAGPIIDGTSRYIGYMATEDKKDHLPVDDLYPDALTVNGVIVATTAEQAKTAVKYTKIAGYDFVKIYDNISREVYEAVWEEAQKQNIKVLGHLPSCIDTDKQDQIGFYRVLQNTIEHISSIHEDMLGEILKANTLIDPTFSVEKLYFGNASQEEEYIAAYDLIHPAVKAQWKIAKEKHVQAYKNIPISTRKPVIRRGDEYYKKMIYEFASSGGRMLAGTDGAIENNIPGYFLHKELVYIEESGISNYEVLKMATVYPAEFYYGNSAYGMISVGNYSRLLILDGNPLEDIMNTQKITYVINKNNIYSMQELENFIKLDMMQKEIEFI